MSDTKANYNVNPSSSTPKKSKKPIVKHDIKGIGYSRWMVGKLLSPNAYNTVERSTIAEMMAKYLSDNFSDADAKINDDTIEFIDFCAADLLKEKSGRVIPFTVCVRKYHKGFLTVSVVELTEEFLKAKIDPSEYLKEWRELVAANEIKKEEKPQFLKEDPSSNLEKMLARHKKAK